MTNEFLESTPMPCTVRAQLLEKEDGYYTTYVFADLDVEGEYYMVTKYPNWIQKEINIGDIGYLTFCLIVAGKSKWYYKEGSTEEKEMFVPYNYTHIAFVKFIKDSNEIIKRKDNDFKIKVI